MSLIPDELFGLLFYNFGLHEGSENSHDAGLEVATLSLESFIMGSQHACPLLQRNTLTLSNIFEKVVWNKIQSVPHLQDMQRCKWPTEKCLNRSWKEAEVTAVWTLALPASTSEAFKEKQFFQCFTSTLLLPASTWLMVHYSLPSPYFSYRGNIIHSSR